jgi:VanZ family protein
MERTKKFKLIKLIITAVLMLAVMIVIFCFSNQNGEQSSEVSNSVGEVIVDILGVEVPEGETPSSVPIVAGLNVRKCAHVTLYMLLGLTSFLFVHSALTYKRKATLITIPINTIGAALISFLYACFDEWHQTWVGGRTGAFGDIGIDSIGYSILIAVCTLFAVCWYLIKKKKSHSD